MPAHEQGVSKKLGVWRLRTPMIVSVMNAVRYLAQECCVATAEPAADTGTDTGNDTGNGLA